MLIFVNVLSKTLKRIKEGNMRAKRSEFAKESKGDKSRFVHRGTARNSGPHNM